MCVVETGRCAWHAKLSQKAAATMTEKKPHKKRSGVLAKVSGLAMPPLMVSVTEAPSSTAPPNSQKAATIRAWGIVRALAPTELAKALATSLAPMPKAQAKEKMHERAKTQV